MRFGICLLALPLLAGCSGERSSYLEFSCPVGKPDSVHVAFIAPTGDWAFNPHAGLHETIRWFQLQLPESPPDPARYTYEQLELTDTSTHPGLDIPLKGGHAVFSVERGTLKLALKTDKGEFWANGEYPFESFYVPTRCSIPSLRPAGLEDATSDEITNQFWNLVVENISLNLI